MKNFVEFKSVEDGDPVAVNVENVTYIRRRIDGQGILIAFQGDDGIGVHGTWEEVLERLTQV